MKHAPGDWGLYLITGREHVARGRTLEEAVSEALEGGLRALQLREKDLGGRELYELALKMRKITAEKGAALIINERADVAVGVGADGVHLGAGSPPPSAIRRIAGESMLIGFSAHSAEEARYAEAEGADFITLSPVFETKSKPGYGPPLGLETFERIRAQVALIVFALGGINLDNARQALGRGASGVALISDVLADPEPRGKTTAYLELFE